MLDPIADLARLEPVLRFTALVTLLGGLGLAEALAPRRPLSQPRRRRWFANLAIVAIDSALLRLVAPAAAFGLAVIAEQRGWGLFHLLDLPGWAAIALTLLLLDLALYAQHVASHAWPALWRLHRVHHTDLDIDVTTGLRFHPAEILLSFFYKAALVVALGADPSGVLIFEILLNAGALFSHSNLRLSNGLDRAIRALWVTPDMHRVHHSIARAETDSNYGTCLSLWDRLFGTYRAQPEAGHRAMTLGIPQFRAPADQTIWSLLTQPLRRAPRTP